MFCLSENYVFNISNLLQTLLIKSFVRFEISRSFLYKIYFKVLVYLLIIIKIVLKDLLISCFLLEGRSVTKSIIIYYQGLFGALIDYNSSQIRQRFTLLRQQISQFITYSLTSRYSLFQQYLYLIKLYVLLILKYPLQGSL